jgi:hypothetical protein
MIDSYFRRSSRDASIATVETTVAGIDVGGTRKGFHAVALRQGKYLAHMASPDVRAIVQWCLNLRAAAVGVDAPCCWSHDGRARLAERELMAKRISCFSTPTRERAEQHPRTTSAGCEMERSCMWPFKRITGCSTALR